MIYNIINTRINEVNEMDILSLRPPKARNVVATIKVLEAQIQQLEDSIVEDGKMHWDLHRLIVNELIDLETEGYDAMSRVLTKTLGEAMLCGFRRAGVRLTLEQMISTGK